MKNIIALSSIILFFAFSACDECDTEVNKLRITTFEPSLVKINGIEILQSGDSIYNTITYTIDSNGIRFDELGISIYNNLESFSRNFNFPFVNSAFACEPVFYFYGVDSIFIYSDQRYDSNHPAGSNLRDIVKLSNSSSIKESTEKDVQGSTCFLNFKSAPENNKSHIFTIVYRLSNGNKTSSVLPKIKILRP